VIDHPGADLGALKREFMTCFGLQFLPTRSGFRGSKLYSVRMVKLYLSVVYGDEKLNYLTITSLRRELLDILVSVFHSSRLTRSPFCPASYPHIDLQIPPENGSPIRPDT